MPKTLCLSETYYQYSVTKNCIKIDNQTHIVWNARKENSFDSADVSYLVRGRIGFFFISIFQLFYHQQLVIGDFRSLIQQCVLITALILRKKVILGEDGLIANIADFYHFDVNAIRDGGIRPFKLVLLKLLRPFLKMSSRITTQPEFVSRVNPNVEVFPSFLFSDTGYVTEEGDVGQKKLVFVGQYIPALGVKNEEVIKILDFINSSFSHIYGSIYFSPHPRGSGKLTEYAKKLGWNISGSIEVCIAQLMPFDLASVSSTCLIDPRFDNCAKFVIDVDSLAFSAEWLRDAQSRCQNVMMEIVDCRGGQLSKLWVDS